MLKSPTFREARDFLLEQVGVMGTERIPLEEAAGRVLAEEVTAKSNVPPFDRSPYDGYALRAEDTANASKESPVTLRILEEIPAGSMWTQPLTPGTASKILTGAPVPDGADCVIMFEKTAFTAESVTIFSPCRSGDNVVEAGEDVREGQLLASAGTRIDGALQGTLAAQGIANPLVYRRPRAAVISTGSELKEAWEELTPGKIVNTNRYVFAAALEKAGCEAVYYGTPGDDPALIADLLAKAAAECDLVVTTGGVSVGDYDYTPEAMERAGAELVLKNIQMKPGSACCFGRKDGKLLCGLSGNPASAATCYYASVLPAVRKLCGLSQPLLPETEVVLLEDYNKKSPRPRLIRGRMDLSGGRVGMHLEAGQGNGVLHSLIGCNLIAEIPGGSPKLPAGTRLKAWVVG